MLGCLLQIYDPEQTRRKTEMLMPSRNCGWSVHWVSRERPVKNWHLCGIKHYCPQGQGCPFPAPCLRSHEYYQEIDGNKCYDSEVWEESQRDLENDGPVNTQEGGYSHASSTSRQSVRVLSGKTEHDHPWRIHCRPHKSFPGAWPLVILESTVGQQAFYNDSKV